MSNVTFLSVCSGIEAVSVATKELGWQAVGFAEIEQFPSAVLAERYGSNMPGEPLSHNAPPNFGDFTAIDLAKVGQVDGLVGGTPCQAFSIAGSRHSLADARGNLTLAFVVLAHELVGSHGLKFALWENVPGVLSTADNAFGCFLGAIVGGDNALPCPEGGSWPSAGMVAGPRARAAWRVLDAQYFGLAQRRKRVFVVASFTDDIDPAKVLFERQGMHGNSAPRRESGQDVAGTLSARTKGGGGLGTDFDLDEGLVYQDVAHCLNAGGMGRIDYETETFVVDKRAEAVAFKPSHFTRGKDGAPSNVYPPLSADADKGDQEAVVLAPVIAFVQNGRSEVRMQGGDGDVSGALQAEPGAQQQTYVAYRTSGNCGAWETGDITDALAIQERAVSAQGVTIHGTDKTARVASYTDVAGALRARTPGGQENSSTTVVMQPVAYDLRGREGGAQFEGPHDTANIRAASGGSSRSYVQDQWAVRRLTPLECERLQGFPDNWTNITVRGKPAADGPRYKALGNSMAVPVIHWICKRIDAEFSK